MERQFSHLSYTPCVSMSKIAPVFNCRLILKTRIYQFREQNFAYANVCLPGARMAQHFIPFAETPIRIS